MDQEFRQDMGVREDLDRTQPYDRCLAPQPEDLQVWGLESPEGLIEAGGSTHVASKLVLVHWLLSTWTWPHVDLSKG